MFNFCSLYSGSSGNCLFVENDNTKLLIDAGVSLKKIEEGLEKLNVDPSSLDGILITHEHSDHIKSLGNLSKKYDLPIYANQKTLNNMEKQIEKIDSKNIHKFKSNKRFSINDIEIDPFSIPHDAADPCGFNIYSNNKKISIATDIGHIENNILKKLEGSLFVLLESNYEPEVLKYTKYPFLLKQRIAGPYGHLSNEDAGKVLSHLVKNGLNTAMLGHLSKESNMPALAYQSVVNEMIANGIDVSKLNLSIAGRDKSSDIIKI